MNQIMKNLPRKIPRIKIRGFSDLSLQQQFDDSSGFEEEYLNNNKYDNNISSDSNASGSVSSSLTFESLAEQYQARKKKGKKYASKLKYTPFYAINFPKLQPVQEENSADSDLFNSSHPLLHKVYVDNLPIDIDEEELRFAFIDRFAKSQNEIAYVQIFNRRPDLDPGVGVDDDTNIVKAPLPRVYVPEKRVRTPVYAEITLLSESTYRQAIDPVLMLFGMVIHDHPVRTRPASDMKTLYLEKIPSELKVLDLEYYLTAALCPDMMVKCRLNQNHSLDHSHSSSISINFHSHENALYAFERFEKLQLEDSNGKPVEIVMNWMQTPPDATKFWTRKKRIV